MVCDFCSTADPTHRIETVSFVVKDVVPLIEDMPMESLGDFLACDACWRLIEAEDRRGLEERSLRIFMRNHPEIPNLAENRVRFRKQCRSFHEQFWEHRIRVKL